MDMLSYYDSETATLTATVVDNYDNPVSNITVEFFKDSTSLGTATTDSNGIATMTYQSHISGNSTFTAKNGGVTSNSINIEEMWYFNDGTKLSNVTIGSGVSCTVTSDNTIRITTSSSGEKYVTYPPTFTNSDNFIIEFEIACTGTTQRTAFWLNDASTANGLWCCYEISQNKFSGGLRSSTINYSTSCSIGDVMKIKQENGTISIYKNDTQIISKETSFTSSTYQFGNYTNSGRVQCLKNIKVKPL